MRSLSVVTRGTAKWRTIFSGPASRFKCRSSVRSSCDALGVSHANVVRRHSKSSFYAQDLSSFASVNRRFFSSESESIEGKSELTNGKFLNYAMLYHDSVAFLISNHLGIPSWMASETAANKEGKTPEQVAKHFDLSLRAASAILVTLCRMGVVQILKDDDFSVDKIVWELTPSARIFLGDPIASTFTSPSIDTLHTNFQDPEKLLQSFRPVETKDIMSEHLEQDDETVQNNARHFMAHMNAQSVCCAEAFSKVLMSGKLGKENVSTLLDIGGGSAIFPITAARSDSNLKGIVFELPSIKHITEEYIEKEGLSERISVVAGDFFSQQPFPSNIDVVLFSNILHDWPHEINMDLLRKALACLRPGGKVVISDLLLADNVASSTSSATSMNIIMLPYTKGRQYRAKELFHHLKGVGFVDPFTTPLVDDYSVIIATKP